MDNRLFCKTFWHKLKKVAMMNEKSVKGQRKSGLLSNLMLSQKHGKKCMVADTPSTISDVLPP
jgi:hypothetical protein